MARAKTRHECTDCGHLALAWTGQCPGCGEWNTLVEATVAEASGSAGNGSRRREAVAAIEPIPLRQVQAERTERMRTGIGELDRVLGGGLVPGSLVLLGGSPGIGKSTLTGMALANLTANAVDTLYVTGEESASQVRLRAERLGDSALDVPAVAESALEPVVALLESRRPRVCVIDSIQTMHSAELSGAPGSVGQVRGAAGALAEVAKRRGIALILVGHVTKEGSLAGPRVLEHLVDCVLQFEGERERTYRTLRAMKNRFGATSEVGVFEMRSGGLEEVADPSARFVDEATRAPGSVVLASMEGTRPVLVEVQALVTPTELEHPRRVANGLDRNRLSLVLAVLARHGRIGLGASDVFVSVVGGVRIEEPGADLAVAMAIASAHRREPMTAGAGRPLACFGELGLTGELRHVAHAEQRVAECRKFGLTPAIGPGPGETPPGYEGFATLVDVLNRTLPRS